MPDRALPDALAEEVKRLGPADIMVGIPSFRNAATIGHVTRAAQAGLVQYFPDSKPVLVLSLIHISEPTRLKTRSRMPSSA